MSYRLVEQQIWDSEDFCALSPKEQVVWFFLLTNPLATVLPGLQRHSTMTITDNLTSSSKRWTPKDVAAALDTLRQRGMMEIDDHCRVVRMPKAPLYNPPTSGKVIVAWFTKWEEMPKSELKYRHIESLRASLPTEFSKEDWATPTWRKTFGGLSIPHGGFDNPAPQIDHETPRARTSDKQPEKEKEPDPQPAAPPITLSQPEPVHPPPKAQVPAWRTMDNPTGRAWPTEDFYEVVLVWLTYQPTFTCANQKAEEYAKVVRQQGKATFIDAIPGLFHIGDFGKYVKRRIGPPDVTFQAFIYDTNGIRNKALGFAKFGEEQAAPVDAAPVSSMELSPEDDARRRKAKEQDAQRKRDEWKAEQATRTTIGSPT